MYSFYLSLISSASTRFLPILSFIVLIFGQNVPLISPVFLKRSLVFPHLLFSSSFMHCSLKKAFLSLYAVLWHSVFSGMYLSLSRLLSLFSLAICKGSSDKHFAFLLFFFFGMVLFAASCRVLQTSDHSSSGTLFTRSNLLNLFITSTNIHRGFKSYLVGLVVFPTFSLSLNFAMTRWWSEL